MPESVWKGTEGSGAYYGRYWKGMETEGSVEKEPEA